MAGVRATNLLAWWTAIVVVFSPTLVSLLVPLSLAPGTAAAESKPVAKKDVGALKSQKNTLMSKRAYLQRKKQEAQRQARSISSQIITNQRKLDRARNTLRYNQRSLTQTRTELGQLTQLVEETRRQADALQIAAKERVRRIYMTGRTNMLQMLLDAKDIPTFMDRLTYKRYLVKQDQTLLVDLDNRVTDYQQQMVQKRRKERQIDASIQHINSLRGSISDRLLHDKKLRERYWKDAKAYERAERDLLAESRKLESEIRSITKKPSSTPKQSQASGGFIWPLKGPITSRFGYRRHPIHRKRLMHTGLDIARPHGYPVKASNSGTVIYSGWRGGYGKVVMINHGNIKGKNVVTLYAHLSATLVKKGAKVSKGQTIAKVGSTGYSTGPHLHFETRENGRPVNPNKYL